MLNPSQEIMIGLCRYCRSVYRPRSKRGIPTNASQNVRGAPRFALTPIHLSSNPTIHFATAFTLIELLVVIAIIAILASLALPAMKDSFLRAQLAQTMSNGKQLYLSSFNMATDAATQGDANLGWPGDLAKETGPGKVTTVKGFIERLMDYNYLKSFDVGRVCAAPGIRPWDGAPGTFDGERNMAFKIYKVTDGDSSATLFAATKNFTYNKEIDASTTVDPYRDKAFVVIRKGGDALSYQPKQARSYQALGLLPGRHDFLDNPNESQNDYLSQQ